MTVKAHVLVIGGGYAGVMAANRLSRDADVTVSLVNPRPTFVERMRLHQYVAGTDDALVAYDSIVASTVQRVVDTAVRIDAANCSVDLANGASVVYDYLIYAVGSRTGEAEVAGGSQFAHLMTTLEDATKLRATLEAAPLSARVTVVGAGPTGIETAAELAEQGRLVTLLCGGALGPNLHPRGRRAVARGLRRLGVDVREGPGSRAVAVMADAVRLQDGSELSSAVTIWTVGFGVPDLASRSGLSTDGAGRLLTDETLTSVDDARIVAAGDCASPSALPYRMSAYAAQPLGAHAADTVLSRIAGQEPTAISLGFLGVCTSLGRHQAMLQVSRPDDTAAGLALRGRLVARLVKEAGTKAVIQHMAHEATDPGAHRLKRTDRTRADRLRAREAGGSSLRATGAPQDDRHGLA